MIVSLEAGSVLSDIFPRTQNYAHGVVVFLKKKRLSQKDGLFFLKVLCNKVK
jgi:hypothetical protein